MAIQEPGPVVVWTFGDDDVTVSDPGRIKMVLQRASLPRSRFFTESGLGLPTFGSEKEILRYDFEKKPPVGLQNPFYIYDTTFETEIS